MWIIDSVTSIFDSFKTHCHAQLEHIFLYHSLMSIHTSLILERQRQYRHRIRLPKGSQLLLSQSHLIHSWSVWTFSALDHPLCHKLLLKANEGKSGSKTRMIQTRAGVVAAEAGEEVHRKAMPRLTSTSGAITIRRQEWECPTLDRVILSHWFC